MRMRSILHALALAALCVGLAAPLPVQGQNGPGPVYRGDCDYPDAPDPGEVVQGAGDPASSQVAAGAYLAAHHACIMADYRVAVDRYGLALAEDSGNPVLTERAAMAYLGLGQVDRAATALRGIEGRGAVNPVVKMVLSAESFKSGDFDAVLENFGDERPGTLIDGLLVAWAQLGQGRMSEALESFDGTVAAAGQGMDVFGLTHKALAQALVGDYEGAEAVLSGLDRRDGLSRRGIIIFARVLSQLERNAEALDLIERRVGATADPELTTLKDELVRGNAVGPDAVRDATDGAAEAFLLAARLLDGNVPANHALIYSRIAEYLNPDSVDATLLSADLLGRLDRFELATESYDRVPREHHSFASAEIGRAKALRESGRSEAAVEVLERLVEVRPDAPQVLVALGDTLRALERYDSASEAYDAAIELYGKSGGDADWRLYFTRAITHEREGRWELAEADFRKALELESGHPDVLNYLGYSFIEMGVNMEEALAMIEEAVAAEPESYYIVDSLGWAQYRMGRYDEAVVNLERAVELEPDDPIVNDHLGDAYWAVGREFEADFQWRRALSFDPEEGDARRIRRKLEIGLDAVLEEEGAPPVGLPIRDD